jgi:hypothetical protein
MNGLRHVVRWRTDLKPACGAAIPHVPVRIIAPERDIDLLLESVLHIGEDVERLRKKLLHGVAILDLAAQGVSYLEMN